MRDFWTFIGGVAVGIITAAGLCVLDEESNLPSAKRDEEELELDDASMDDNVNVDDAMIAR